MTATLPVRIAVTLACYNRKALTLRCLGSLAKAADPGMAIEVFLFDDASPDGTAEAVRDAFPETRIIEGDGKQFWCGGMRAAMRAANETEYDFMLWLNDDVELAPAFLLDLLRSHAEAQETRGPGPHVIIGAVIDPESGELTYSGYLRTSKFHPAKFEKVVPNGSLQACDTMNGNCVLLPAAVVEKVGEIDPAYVQQIGDADYGYRCVEAGGRLWVAPKSVGTCAPNRPRMHWTNRDLSLGERWRVLNTHVGLPPGPWLHFMWRFGGPLGVVLLFAGYAKWFAISLLRGGQRA